MWKPVTLSAAQRALRQALLPAQPMIQPQPEALGAGVPLWSLWRPGNPGRTAVRVDVPPPHACPPRLSSPHLRQD